MAGLSVEAIDYAFEKLFRVWRSCFAFKPVPGFLAGSFVNLNGSATLNGQNDQTDPDWENQLGSTNSKLALQTLDLIR